MATVAEQVEKWNEFIAMNEEYVVMFNDEEEDDTYPITTLEMDEPSAYWVIINQSIRFNAWQIPEFFDNFILYRLTRLDPIAEFSMLDRGIRNHSAFLSSYVEEDEVYGGKR